MSVVPLTKVKRVTQTHQTLPSPSAPVLQVKNSAGGHVFEISAEKQLDRYLIIGTSGGTFYQDEKSIAGQNLDVIVGLIKSNGAYVVNRIVEISQAGRARKNDQALEILALCFVHGNLETKALAREALPKVARIGTHLLHFIGFVNDMRGWGSSLKKAVADWYNNKSADDVAYQAIKYQQRDGWSQRDVLRLAHPKAKDEVKQNVYKYITRGYDKITNPEDDSKLPKIITGFEYAKVSDLNDLPKLILDYGLTMEMIPTHARNSLKVWEALLQGMGATALIRNLNKMTAVGLVQPLSEASKAICERLNSPLWIRKARLHPLQLLVAKKIYERGCGDKGDLVWTPDQNVVASLENAFYSSFETIVPSGKNRFMAIDVSGSMNSACSGAPQVSCREAAAVLAMASVRAEPNSVIYGFDHEFRDLGITRNDSLKEVCSKTFSHRFGSTDCSLPMLHALKSKMDVDQFEVYTDNETFYGSMHPFEAINKYRKEAGKQDAGLAVVAMTASRFSIANPKDQRMLDLVGFDTATPGVLADFAIGLL